MRALTQDTPCTYRICVYGTLDASLGDWLEGMAISSKCSETGQSLTILAGYLADQAALLGVLSTLYDLHYPLVSVELVSPGQSER